MSTAKPAFVPHSGVPRPVTLDVAKADNSGVVNTDPQFIADRQAIINHVTAYSYLIDESRWEDWFDLFSEDVVFQNTTPELGTVLIEGKPAFRELVRTRYIEPGKKNAKGVRRHTQGNVHVAEQTATTAKVRTYLFISSVPAADKLSMATSGTYNAELEKRDGKWTITRWYIECDAPLNPSPLPEGFTEEEFKWVPDPTFEIPGAGPVAKAEKGKVTLDNLPFAMGELYQNAPVWTWSDIDVVIIDHLTTNQAATAVLPEQLTTFPIPELPGYSPVKQIWAHYRDSSFGPYDEFIQAIPCLYDGELYLYVSYIYVDNDSAMAGGREIGGWPKKYGKITMERVGDDYVCALDRRGERIASAKMHVGGKLFSTPLPAKEPVYLSYPYNMTFPLPAPTGKEQETVPFPTSTLKWVPGVGGDGKGNPRPSLARLIGAPWHMKGTFHGGGGAAASYGKSDLDPMYKIPNLKTLGAMYFTGDMTLKFSDMVVLDDMLKSNGGPPKK